MNDSNTEQGIKDKISSMEFFKFRKKFVIYIVLACVAVYASWIFGEAVADIIIFAGIEWLRVSTIGSLVVVFGAIITIKFVDRFTDKSIDSYIQLLEKKLSEDK